MRNHSAAAGPQVARPGQGAKTKSISIPLASTGLGSPPKDRVFMGIWDQLGASRCGDTHPALPPAPHPHALFQGRRGGGRRGAPRLTGDVDLDGNLRPAHVVLCPAGHVLSVEVTGDIGQGQPQGWQTPRLLCQGRQGDTEGRQLASGPREAGGWRCGLSGEGRERVGDLVHRLSPAPPDPLPNDLKV